MNDRAATDCETRVIRYLVNSVDDLREIADTVRYIVQQNAEPNELLYIVEGVPVSTIQVGDTSGFIMSFKVPCELLEKASKNKGKSSDNGVRNKFDIGESVAPQIKVSGSWSQFTFEVMTLKDLISAVYSTMRLYKTASERIEYVNLKSRTIMKSKPREHGGIILLFQVPGILSEPIQGNP